MSNRRKVLIAAGVGLTAAEAAVVARRRGSLWAVSTVVRCQRGHMYTTIWIPGVSIKSVRLGWWRLQRCPVGNHFALVTPVRTSDLSTQELHDAEGTHDVRIP